MNKNVFDKYIIDEIKSIINGNDIEVIGRNAKEISKDIWNLNHIYPSEVAKSIFDKCDEEILSKLNRCDSDIYDIFKSMFDDATKEDFYSMGVLGGYDWIYTVVAERWELTEVLEDIFERYLHYTFDSFVEKIIKEEEEKRKEEQEMETTELKETEKKEDKSNDSLKIFDDYIVKEIKEVIKTYKININNPTIDIIDDIICHSDTHDIAYDIYKHYCNTIEDYVFKDLFEELVRTDDISFDNPTFNKAKGIFYYIQRLFECGYTDRECFYIDLIQIYLDSHYEKFIKIIKEEEQENIIVKKEYAIEIFNKSDFVRQEDVLQTPEECIAYILNNTKDLQNGEYYKILQINYDKNEREISTKYL